MQDCKVTDRDLLWTPRRGSGPSEPPRWVDDREWPISPACVQLGPSQAARTVYPARRAVRSYPWRFTAVSVYEGKLRIEGEQDAGIDVEIDLDGERMKVVAGDVEVADWALDDVRISALVDGFHIRAQGEAAVLDVREDGHFAIELGLRTAHPALRRKMSALLREGD